MANKGKVLVTGAGGFIGSHLTEMLLRQGYEVRAVVRYNSNSSWGWLEQTPAELRDGLEVVLTDVRDPSAMHDAVEGVSCIYHLAALIGIPYSYVAPDSYVDTNIKGTLNILQAARKANTERVLVTSTSEVYGTALEVPITETHPRQGQSPYSATKIGADHLAQSFHLSFGLPITIVRPFNTYGPRQSARAIIPTIISQLLADVKELQLGSLSPTRDLVFVEDTANGFISIANSTSLLGEEVNIATEQEIAIGALVELIMKTVGREVPVQAAEERIRPKGSEVERLLGSSKKLKAHTDWEPQFNLEQGLVKTLEWFKAGSNHSFYKWQSYNV